MNVKYQEKHRHVICIWKQWKLTRRTLENRVAKKNNITIITHVSLKY